MARGLRRDEASSRRRRKGAVRKAQSLWTEKGEKKEAVPRRKEEGRAVESTTHSTLWKERAHWKPNGESNKGNRPHGHRHTTRINEKSFRRKSAIVQEVGEGTCAKKVFSQR